MEYKKFLESKRKSFIESGFEIDESKLNKNLFDFQKYAVKTALRKGKFALFFDCGLGKTLMQLSWSEAVYNETNKKVLVLFSNIFEKKFFLQKIIFFVISMYSSFFFINGCFNGAIAFFKSVIFVKNDFTNSGSSFQNVVIIL